MKFEFVVLSPAFSVNRADRQPKKHREWKDKVRGAAESQWTVSDLSPSLPIFDPVQVTITTFFTAISLDVDNVIKPILDSMKKDQPFSTRFSIYKDDNQIYKVMSERVDLKARTVVESPSDLLARTLETQTEFVLITLEWEESED